MSLPSPQPHGRLPDPGAELRTLRGIAESLGQLDCVREIDVTLRALESGTLRIAVLGQFKRGKSTLLNAILGRDLLPTGVLPLTSVATEIRDGEGELWVFRADGPPFRTAPESLAEYVTERRNPENVQHVDRVELRVPLPAWARDVVFRDTPGVGSIHESTTREASRLLSEVDAAIFVLSPDPPVSAVELAFLRAVSEHAAKFFFVLNKVDLVPPDELEALTDYLARALRERAGFAQPTIYRVSARRALEQHRDAPEPAAGDPGLSQLVVDLTGYLGRGRATALRESAGRRAARYGRRLLGAVQLARTTFRADHVVFVAAMDRLDRATHELREEQRAADAVLDADLARMISGLDPELDRFRAQEGPPIAVALERRLDGSRAVGGAHLVQEFDEAMREELLPRVAELRTSLERQLLTGLEAAGGRYVARTRALLGDVERTVRAVFRVDVPAIEDELDLAPTERYYPHAEGIYEATFAGQTMLLLPAAALRRRLRTRLPTIVAERLDQQAGRVRSDLFERGQRTVSEFRVRMHARLDESALALRHAAAAGQEAASADPRTRAEWAERLDRWEADLRPLLDANAPPAVVLPAEPGGPP